MQYVISVIEQHGLVVVFLNVLLAQSGLPLPAFPTLVTAAALVTQNRYRVPEIILAGVSGSLIADLVWYWSGARYGRRILGLLCRMSLSPDFCVRQSETVFAKVGPWSLLFAKFFPGLSIISVAMAGVTKMSLPVFLSLNGIGALLSVSVPVVLGWIFKNAITDILFTLADIGKLGVVAVFAALGLYLLARWWRRKAFIRQLRMDRITVDELLGLIDEGQKLLILDVRPKEVRAQEGIIPGAAVVGLKGWIGVAEEVSDISLSCRQVGPNSLQAKVRARRGRVPKAPFAVFQKDADCARLRCEAQCPCLHGL